MTDTSIVQGVGVANRSLEDIAAEALALYQAMRRRGISEASAAGAADSLVEVECRKLKEAAKAKRQAAEEAAQRAAQSAERTVKFSALVYSVSPCEAPSALSIKEQALAYLILWDVGQRTKNVRAHLYRGDPLHADVAAIERCCGYLHALMRTTDAGMAAAKKLRSDGVEVH